MLLAISNPVLPNWTDLRPFVAEAWLIAAMVAVLITPFFTRRLNWPCAAIALAGLALAFLSNLLLALSPEPLGQHLAGMLVADQFSLAWKGLLLLFVIGILIMWMTTTARTMHEGDGANSSPSCSGQPSACASWPALPIC